MQEQRTSPGQKRLSETARHIIKPSGIVSTGFPAVRARSLDMGLPMDSWQDGIGRLALSKRADGLYAAGIGGVVASIPRQTGKTYLISAIVFALCTLFPNLTVIWTAHRVRTHNETFKKMQGMAGRSKVAPYIENVRLGSGDQEIAFKNGSRILFGARESGFGRGFDEVDILVLDEAQILSEDAMSDMVPATNAAPNGLVFLVGTPPRPKDPGEVFSSARKRALEGDDDTVYVEFSADEDAGLDDKAQLAKANPSYPHRTSDAAIQRMRKLLGSDDNFRREAYGIWDKESIGLKVFTTAAWNALKGKEPEGRIVYGVRFTADGSGVALAMAIRPEDGPVYVKPIRQSNLGDGIQWLVDFLADNAAEAAQIIIDGKSGVGFLVNALQSAGVRNKRLVLVPTLDQVIQAHSMFEQSVRTGGITHPGVEAFDDQVTSAMKRKIGTAGGFGWASVDGGTVVALEAATLAHWGARITKRRPGTGGGLI